MKIAHLKFIRFEKKELERSKQIGDVAIAWNLMHHVVYCFFVGFSGRNVPSAAKAFFDFKQDSVQRSVTQFLGYSILKAHADAAAGALAERYDSQFERVNKLSPKRNGIVHSPLLFDRYYRMGASPYSLGKKPELHTDYFKNIDGIVDEFQKELEAFVGVFNDVAELLRWPGTILRTIDQIASEDVISEEKSAE